MAAKKTKKHAKKIDYKEKMKQTLQTILDLQHIDQIRNWFNGISNLMLFGRDYSSNNLLLVHAQKREAIWTEGFCAWKTKYRRFVQKGEKGILIFAPIPVKAEKSEPRKKTDARIDQGDQNEEPSFVLFRPVYVWDYSQTRGDRVARIERMLEKRNETKKKVYSAQGENLEKLSAAMTGLVADSGIEIAHKDLGSAGGMARKKTIFVDSVLDTGEDLDVLIHEYAHIMLGHTEGNDNRSDVELEADLTVGLVKSGLDLDIQPQAAYLFDWSRGASDEKREEKFMKAFNMSQPLANQVLNHLVAAVESDDEKESNTDIAA